MTVSGRLYNRFDCASNFTLSKIRLTINDRCLLDINASFSVTIVRAADEGTVEEEAPDETPEDVAVEIIVCGESGLPGNCRKG